MIRLYQHDDFSDVAYLNQVCYEKPCTGTVLREKLADKAWVWVVSGSVVGCIILEGNCVWSLTVAPTWRNRNIGNALLAEAERHSPELWLHTEPTGKAKKLYLRRGFQIVKTETDFYGPGQDALLMVKRERHTKTVA